MIPRSKSLAVAILAAAFATASAWAEIPVTIGVMSDMSGVYSDIGGQGSVEAVRMAVEDFKSAEKGLKVTVVSADPQNKPDVGVTIARKWYDVDGVDMIIDLPTSAVSMAVGQVAQERNKVALYSASASSDMTGKACTPNTIHWTYDTWALSHGTGEAIVQTGGKTWFFITADYTFGQALERDTSEVVKANGGTVLGSVRHPLSSTDFSSFILQAQASKAQVIGLANGGNDTTSAIKTAAEFGLVQGGQKMAGMLLFLSDIHSLGLQDAQGLMLTTAFYWDLNERTRDFARRFAERNDGRYPTMSHAGTYSSTLAYLAAVQKLGGTDDGRAVIKAIRDASPIDDPLFGPVSVRIDGRAIHDMYLVEVKSPAESKGPYDYYKLVATIPAERAFRPLADGGCPLVNQ